MLEGFPNVKAGVAVNRNRGERIPSTVNYANHDCVDVGYGDTGSAARFFYCAKASKKDRDEGLEGFEEQNRHTLSGGAMIAEGRTAEKGKAAGRNIHPTVKPTDLMRCLCRLVTQPGGVVLDPFMGSGSTGKAALLEGFQFIGIERDEEYMKIAESRIAAAIKSASAESA